MIKIPGMLMIGASGRDVGKTEFACSLIRKFNSLRDIIGIKVTAIEQDNGSCPRGGAGCGVCATLEGDFCITEETDSQSDKDTCRMRAAGAARVFWLRVLKSHLEEGVKALLNVVGDNAIMVCESNSLREVVEPGLFVMVENSSEKKRKPSAESVAGYVDRFISFDGEKFDVGSDEIELVDGRWGNKMEATAIIMAGGDSGRMGQDKSMLAIKGQPMIKHIYDQLCPHFNQILVSSNEVAKYGFLGIEVIADRVAGRGPLMGIASALEISANDINFVVACDIPQIDMGFVRAMIRQSRGYDAVLPKTLSQQYEPLFAVYSKSVLAVIEESLAAGNNRIIDALSDCKVKYVNPNGAGLENLNTMSDYKGFVGNEKDVTI